MSKSDNNKNNDKIPRNVLKTGGYKYLDTGLGGDVPSTTSGALTLPSLNIIPTGTNANTRVGKKVRIFRVDFRIQLSRGYEANTTVSACTSRVCLILDNATRGISPAFTDIFETANINSFVNATNSSRFSILKEWNTTINTLIIYNPGTSQFNTMAKTVVVTGSFKTNIPLLFSSTGTTGVVAQTVTNCLLLTFIGDNTSTSMVQAGTAFRVYFVDES